MSIKANPWRQNMTGPSGNRLRRACCRRLIARLGLTRQAAFAYIAGSRAGPPVA
jgi:hypothetical protein